MDLVLTEEQSLLRQAAKELVTARSPVSRVRKADDPRALWKEMADLGWLGLAIDEAHGGAGLGYGYLMVVLERLGANLVPEPVISTAVIAATALSLGGTDAAKAEHLPRIARGERVFAFAHQEASGRFQPAAIDTSASAEGGGFVLHGEKVHVADGTVADWFLVSARAPDGLALFVVPRTAAGVSVLPQTRIDGRSAAIVRFEKVTVTKDDRVGAVERGQRLLERVVDAGTAALCAEMLGAMTAAFAMTLDYLKTRVQFGQPIGAFQALQHRASRLYVETELARSAVMSACALLDGKEPSTSVSRAVSIAKAKCSDAFMQIANESIQLHGGIGMTDEHDIGLYLKRARVCEMTFGDAAFHRDRFARLAGF
jgi:alkylation response protein AidB-like acyl-CoA dehydrogenase